jgi:4-amino-4-deoxy-L-arabinose transferase-like glycosyltransferase
LDISRIKNIYFVLIRRNNLLLLTKTELLCFSKCHKVDILFIIFFISFSIYFYSHVSTLANPPRDGADYLTNARNWLSNDPLYSKYRPPLISWIIAGVWVITGENWLIIKYLIPLFTLAAGFILYMLLRKEKGNLFAFGVSALTLLNPHVFFWGEQIHTEGLSLFFIILTLYFLKSKNKNNWIWAGIAFGLTFASRYSTRVEVTTIFVVECIIRKDPRFATKTLLTALPIILVSVLLVYLKVGYFMAAQESDTHFTLLLTPYYLQNSLNIWGFAILLVPVAFLFRRTYQEKYNYTFIAWFIVSLLFWSANSNPILHLPRYTVQFAPAVYFLAILAVENIAKLYVRNDTKKNDKLRIE